MTLFDAIILGIVQGITEFLPVSSSGHLKLFQYFLGFDNLDRYLGFDLVCHLGTLFAIFIVFKRRFYPGKSAKKMFWLVAIGTLPLFPLLLMLQPIRAAYSDPSYLGFFFLVTAAILFLGWRYGKSTPEGLRSSKSWKDAFRIGMWQAAAILPGVSRSGATITGARLLGWEAKDAVAFSFLLAIPAIGGGTLLELWKLWQQPESTLNMPLSSYLSGFFVSFFVGIAALQLLIRLAIQNRFHYFAWYCLFLGLATTLYFHI